MGRGRSKSDRLVAEETREIRIKMDEYMREAFGEAEALAKALPADANRSKKLRDWKSRGLWPIPPTEREALGLPPAPDQPQELLTKSPQLLPSEVEELRQMIRERHEPRRPVPARPAFRGRKKNTGIQLSEDVLNAAMRRLRADATVQGQYGDSLSRLVETLLWTFAGSPKDLIEQEQKEDD